VAGSVGTVSGVRHDSSLSEIGRVEQRDLSETNESPDLWIAPSMEDGDDDDGVIVVLSEEDSVREAT